MGIVYDKKPEIEKPTFAVFPENAQVVEMFLRCATQWRMSFSGPSGLDYPAVIKVLEIYGVMNIPAVLDDLRIMERAALDEIHSKKEKK